MRKFSPIPYFVQLLVSLLILLVVIFLTSCSTRKINRSVTTTDSTHNQTTQVKAEDINKSTAVKTTTVRDESGQKVVFRGRVRIDTLRDTVTVNRVVFKQGKIVEASGNILEATANASHWQDYADSVATENMVLRDSLQSSQFHVKQETKTVTKVVRPAFAWFLLAALGGAGIALYLRYLLYKKL